MFARPLRKSAAGGHRPHVSGSLTPSKVLLPPGRDAEPSERDATRFHRFWYRGDPPQRPATKWTAPGQLPQAKAQERYCGRDRHGAAWVTMASIPVKVLMGEGPRTRSSVAILMQMSRKMRRGFPGGGDQGRRQHPSWQAGYAESTGSCSLERERCLVPSVGLWARGGAGTLLGRQTQLQGQGCSGFRYPRKNF